MATAMRSAATVTHGKSARKVRLHGGRLANLRLMSLRGRLLIAFLAVAISALGTVGLAMLLVGPGYFRDAMEHLPGDPMGEVMDAVAREAFAHAMQRALFAATLTAAITVVVVSLAVATRIARPVTGFAAAARRIAAGRYAERVPEAEPGELGDLAVSFNEMAESLEATEQRRLQLVGDVAHELRTPLTTLDGYLEGLEDGVIDPSPRTWHLMRVESSRLTRLVNELADLWRVEANRLPLRIERVDAAGVARDVAQQFSPLASERAVRIEVSTTPAIALADHDRLAQVLSNFLSNAIRHAPDSSVVRVTVADMHDVIRVSVADEGPGLAQAHLEAVFERFYRVDPARSRSSGGAGIGLTIVRALANAMGGRAWAESAGEGLGATFLVELPAAPPP